MIRAFEGFVEIIRVDSANTPESAKSQEAARALGLDNAGLPDFCGGMHGSPTPELMQFGQQATAVMQATLLVP
jgi:hypothetical protein